ncbi:TRAP transporter small permease [Alkalihalobacillus sp. LMS39]|uniref:TRAP transporter small permease n=1 Tax=Alkalihalobacillus sp. LMS39 TaxID=2924032 RepID=UPI001FB2B068|nr:TRAP transporter small permease [Alkalihalobacillus sp. LMS39]UOE94894.1 TRAP transporter small permease [Alkalihalobacillus sp. LMS39]
MYKTIVSHLNKVIELISASMLGLMVVLIFFQVISREIMGSSFPWTEEAARYLMFWVTFLGASFAFQYGAHIGIEFFKMKCPPMLQKVFEIAALLCGTTFFLFMIVQGYAFAERSMVQTSAALNLPMGYVYMVIPISGFLMLLNAIDVTIQSLKGNELEQKGL